MACVVDFKNQIFFEIIIFTILIVVICMIKGIVVFENFAKPEIYYKIILNFLFIFLKDFAKIRSN